MLAKDILDSVDVAVDFERCQYGYVFLSTIEGTLDDDVGQTQLLASLQVIEEEFQTACAFTSCCTGDVIVLDGILTRVVTLG